MKKYFLCTFVLFLVVFGLARLYYFLTDDFRLSNITYEMPYETKWDIQPPTLDEEQLIQQMLSQPFYYLGKGAQSYAFSSADDQYVLKFFKFKHLRPSWFVDILPSIGPIKHYQEKQKARKARKLFGVFNSYKLAYDVDRNESGLLFIQLNRVGNPSRLVVVVDKLGMNRTVDLQHIPFILQKKGVVLRDVLDDLLKRGDIALAKKRISQVFALYSIEYNKGVFDHDHGVMRNIGFVGNDPIHLDVGKLLADEAMKNPIVADKDRRLVSDTIYKWIDKYYSKYSVQLSDLSE